MKKISTIFIIHTLCNCIKSTLQFLTSPDSLKAAAIATQSVSQEERREYSMSETADILIIGGGVMGASIAHSLARQGGSGNCVVLLERHALCSGTTGRSGAIVRQHYSNDFTVRMAKDSLAVF